LPFQPSPLPRPSKAPNYKSPSTRRYAFTFYLSLPFTSPHLLPSPPQNPPPPVDTLLPFTFYLSLPFTFAAPLPFLKHPPRPFIILLPIRLKERCVVFDGAFSRSAGQRIVH